MIVAIQDANILIDLHRGGLLEACFRLGIETHTTDLVMREVSHSMDAYMLSGQLRIKTFTETETAALLAFKAEQPAAFSPDQVPSRDLASALRPLFGGGE